MRSPGGDRYLILPAEGQLAGHNPEFPILPTYPPKDPNDADNYVVDWGLIGNRTSIQSFAAPVISPTGGVMIGTITTSGWTLTMPISGGTAGTYVTIGLTVTMADGQVYSRAVILPIAALGGGGGGVTPPPPPSDSNIELEDGSGFFLLEDASGYIILES